MMKKICFLTDSIFSIGGVQRVTAVIAKELAKEYDVSIFSFDNSQKSYNTQLYGLNEQNIHYQFFAYPDVAWLKGFLFKVHRAIYIKLKSKTKGGNLKETSLDSKLLPLRHSELMRRLYDWLLFLSSPKIIFFFPRHLAGYCSWVQ